MTKAQVVALVAAVAGEGVCSVDFGEYSDDDVAREGWAKLVDQLDNLGLLNDEDVQTVRPKDRLPFEVVWVEGICLMGPRGMLAATGKLTPAEKLGAVELPEGSLVSLSGRDAA